MNKITTLVLITFVCLLTRCTNNEQTVTPDTGSTNTQTTVSASGSSPNILLIIADDLGVDAAPGYNVGTTKPHMPNLQALAASGITFENVWAYPTCSPTRASILTGRYGYRTGILSPRDANISTSEKSIQKYLDENTAQAYSHAVIGKWHLSGNPGNPQQMGVGHYAGFLEGQLATYDEWTLTENGQQSNYEGYCTTKFTDMAIDWINQQDKSWFCWLAYTAPHTPFHLPADSLHSQGSLPTDQASIDANPTPYFMAMTESIDSEIGRLLKNIPTDELENTIIIFVGDNGTASQVIQAPYLGTQAKGTLYQGGVHVPMIVSGKGVTRINERDDNLISTTDFFATIAEIAGVSLPAYEDSYSFNSLFTTNTTGSRTYNYSEGSTNDAGYTIRNQQYKLIQFDSGARKFYDLVADPYEQAELDLTALTNRQKLALKLLYTEANNIRN